MLVYIHLNPVAAGVVDDPVEYRWSGHRELLGRVSKPLCDVDQVLALFGTTKRSARAAYLRALRESVGESWSGEQPGRLPWWRLGRPRADDEEDPEATVRQRKARAPEQPGGRPRLSAEEYLVRGAEVLGVPLSDLQSRQRGGRVVRARELLAVVGVERYGLRVKDLAEGLRQAPDTITKAIGRATRRRVEDPSCRQQLDEVDRAVVANSPQKATNNGGMA